MKADFKYLEFTSADGLLGITLDKPPHHILDIAMLEELVAAIELAAADASCRLLTLTATGGKSFCAGVDIADHSPERAARMLEVFHAAVRRLHDFPLPTLAVLNGSAIGGGCELALACDMAIACDDIRLGLPEIRLGVFAPAASILLQQRLPLPKVMELLLGGRLIGAAEALALGLLNKVASRAGFAAATADFIAPFLAQSRVALLHAKRAIRAAAGKSLSAALPEVERIYLQETMQTADAREGLAAFLEKRAPRWSNS
jgi:cyclohexa-1,5-dienecarbonyl-CoA hydratase